MNQGDRTEQADKRILEWVDSLEPEKRAAFFRSIKRTREGIEPDKLFDTIVGGGFEHMDFVACSACREWMSRTYEGRGRWAVRHRRCASFQFFADFESVPEDYASIIGPLDLPAGVLDDWKNE